MVWVLAKYVLLKLPLQNGHSTLPPFLEPWMAKRGSITSREQFTRLLRVNQIITLAACTVIWRILSVYIAARFMTSRCPLKWFSWEHNRKQERYHNFCLHRMPAVKWWCLRCVQEQKFEIFLGKPNRTVRDILEQTGIFCLCSLAKMFLSSASVQIFCVTHGLWLIRAGSDGSRNSLG